MNRITTFVKNLGYADAIFVAQIIALLSFIPMIAYAGITEWAIALLLTFGGACLGGTMTYHRLLSHRSWHCPVWLEYVFVAIETVMLSGSAIAWVAVHREHHKHSDNEKDPHSPEFKGYFYVHFLSMYIKPKIKYAVDLMRKPFYLFQHKWYFTINAAYAGVLYLIDPFAVIYAWLIPASLTWHIGSSIISVSHLGGTPRNNTLHGIISFGEGWHKNHHDNWRRKRLHKLDLGGWIIEGIEYVSKPKR